ncbi:MAG TPA: DNA-protecting protein DprA [Ruminiclostridium sp.]|nr:DNA-protecting protein DprA [Ruminiclostridium sp.]
MNSELEFWLRLNSVEGLNMQTKLDLITCFGSATKVFEADRQALLQAGFTARQFEIYHSDTIYQDVQNILELCEKNKIKIVTIADDEYPEMLKYIPSPPLLLYIRGSIPKANAIAVVGSRKASGYGIETAVKMAADLSAAGILVVSGMARGIDTAAHCGALNAGGQTVAVLGCGVDQSYPPENKALMERIILSGAVISEYPPGSPPAISHFPARNRIISGMSLGTLVVEAGIKSGSLITARFSLDQGREVFAVPGDINHYNSMGTNRLIMDGAKMVINVDDILEELNFGIAPLYKGKEKTTKKRGGELGPECKKVISALKIEDLYGEEISSKTSIPLKALFAILLDLELKGLIKKSLTGKYRLLA